MHMLGGYRGLWTEHGARSRRAENPATGAIPDSLLGVFPPMALLACLLAAAPASSKGYYSNLSRSMAERVEISREQGPVIFIVVDALRPDRMSTYGFERATTPNLDQLADDGVVLTRFFVNGNWTRPSTASMLTGLPPVIHGVESERDKLADSFVTLAEVLGSVDVPTGAVVGNGNAGSAFGLGRGFDFYADTVKHWKGLPSAEQVVELAVPFVKAHRDDPFFLMLFFVDPHDPYGAPGEFENMFVEDESTRLIRRPHWELGRYSPAELERMKATYDGAVRYTDSVLGSFFDTLRTLGVYDKATIIVTADHGEAFGEHGVFLHSHHFYDEIVRVPMIIRAPRMSVRGVYNPYLFQTLDLLPTIANYYGAGLPKGLLGVDIVANLKDPSRNDPKRVVISEFNNFGIRRRMIRSYNEKIIYEDPADEKEFMATVGNRAYLPSVSFDKVRVQAFDLKRDPMETRDIYTEKLMRRPRWKRLFERIKYHRITKPSAQNPPIVQTLDPETYKDLQSLGYVD